MDAFCVLLRGVNVSGRNLIKMADLRGQLGEIGLCNIQTYIQSGNLTFTAVNRTTEELESLISKFILDKYGYDIKVWAKDSKSFYNIFQHNPFLKMKYADKAHLLVTFLSEMPKAEKILELENYATSGEEIVCDEKQFYLHFPRGYGFSKLSNNFIEKKLNINATTRNWNTIIKLVEMLESYR